MSGDARAFVDGLTYEARCPQCGAEWSIPLAEVRAADVVRCPNGHEMKVDTASFEQAGADMAARIDELRRKFGG